MHIPDPETALPGTYPEKNQHVSTVFITAFMLLVIVALTECQSKAAYGRGVWFWLAVGEDTVHGSRKAWW